MLTFITWLRYCSSGFLTVKLLIPTLNPLKCSLWKVVTKHSQPILKEGRVMLYLSKMKYMHKLFGMVFLNTILLENFWCWILSPNSLNWSHILFFKNMIYNLKIRSTDISFKFLKYSDWKRYYRKKKNPKYSQLNQFNRLNFVAFYACLNHFF